MILCSFFLFFRFIDKRSRVKSVIGSLRLSTKNKCNKCPRKFSRRTDLMYHLRHECGRTWQCQKCKKKFIARTTYTCHISKKGLILFMLFTCIFFSLNLKISLFIFNLGGQCYSSGSAKKANTVVSNKKDADMDFSAIHICICGMIFTREIDLKSHQNLECGKELKCPDCQKTFSQKNALDDHVDKGKKLFFF